MIEQGSWRSLIALAEAMTVQAAQHMNTDALPPRLGGGIRLMLEYRHRISNDVDLFVRDAQWLIHFSPRTHRQFGADIQSFEESGSALTLNSKIGQIRLNVAQSLLYEMPETSRDSVFALDTCAEVIAKKLFYRGELLTCQDLFDWMTVTGAEPDLTQKLSRAGLLRGIRLLALEARLAMMASDPQAQQKWATIRPSPVISLVDAVGWATGAIKTYA